MEEVLYLVRYFGIVIIALMAILSLFFNFAEENESSSRKRVMTPGVIALWITCVGIMLSLGATIMKDILDSRKEAKLANEGERRYSEGKRMHAEVKLASEVFENIELRWEFSDQIDWQDEGFLSRRLVEGMGESLLKQDNIELIRWGLSKSPEKSANHKDTDVTVL